MLEPIYITGAGVVSAIGIGKAETLASLQKGLSGIGEMKYLRSVHRELPVGEVKLSNAEMMKMLGADPDPDSRARLLSAGWPCARLWRRPVFRAKPCSRCRLSPQRLSAEWIAANSSMPKKTPPTACMPPSQPTAVQHLPI